jgi:hypothetical protein
MPLRRFPTLCLLLALGLLLPACDSGGAEGDAPASILQLTVTNLRGLQGGRHYEGWAVIDDRPVSTGKFNVAGNGALLPVGDAQLAAGRFTTSRDLRQATRFYVTIEPADDTDARPFGAVVLAGDVVNREAPLSMAHELALGVDLAAALGGGAGSFVLATPSNGPASDELSGLWFAQDVYGTPGALLRLPPLATSSWNYEGWVVYNGLFLSTGRFRGPSGRDRDSRYSLEERVPALPGEDFFVNPPRGLSFPISLAGSQVFVTLEPQPDDDPEGPFYLRPLSGAAPSDAVTGTPYPLTAVTTLPQGVARILAE